MYFSFKINRLWLLVLLLTGGGSLVLGQTTINRVPANAGLCAGETINYVIDPVSPTASYYWTVTGGSATQSQGSTNAITWDQPGSGLIQVVIIDNGITTAIDLTEEVPASLQADITEDPTLNCFVSGTETVPGIPGVANHGEGSRKTVKVCEGSVITLSGHPSGLPASSYNWQASGNVSISGSGEQVTMTAGLMGSGFVTLEVTDESCSEETYFGFFIVEHPVASFTANGVPSGGTLSICQGQSVSFQSTSTVPNNEYVLNQTWTISGAVFGVGESATYTFDNPGNYVVSLGVENCGACGDKTNITIVVDPAPAPQIECISWVCEGNTGTYSSPDFCAGAVWTAHGGTFVNCSSGSGSSCNDAVVEVEWNGSPPFALELDVSACGGSVCSVPAYYEVPSFGTLQITGDILLDTDNGNNTFYSVSPVAGGFYDWTVTFDDGTVFDNSHFFGTGNNSSNIVLQFADIPTAATSFVVEVNVSSSLLECDGFSDLRVVICSTPQISCTNGSGQSEFCFYNICEGESKSFDVDNQNGNAVVSWDIILDGALVQTMQALPLNYTFNDPGNYVIRASYQDLGNFCENPPTVSFRVNEIPDIEIEGPEIIPCDNEFYIYSVPSVANYKVTWNVSSGFLSGPQTGNVATIRFVGAGPYTVTAQYTSSLDQYCPSAIASFTVIQELSDALITGNDEACFESTEVYSFTPAVGSIYTWEILDPELGSIVSGQGSPEITVDWHGSTVSPTSTTIRLQTTLCGNSETIDFPVDLAYPPVPVCSSVSPGAICPDGTVTFTVDPQATNGVIRYIWNFNDGSPEAITTVPTVTHTFSLPSETDRLIPIDVKVEYVDEICSNAGSGSCQVRVYPEPLAYLTHTPNAFCPGDPVSTTLYATVSNYPGASQSYVWHRNGVAFATTTDPRITVTQEGNYTVMVVRDYGNGVICSSLSDPVKVYIDSCPPPQCTCAASINQTTGVNCHTIDFNATLCTGGQVVSWLVSDGSFYGANSSISHEFEHAGLYYVTVFYVKGKCRLSETVEVPIYLVPDFNIDEACTAGNVRSLILSDRSEYFIPDNPASDYIPDTWSWSDGSTILGSGSNIVVPMPSGPTTMDIIMTVSSAQTTCVLEQSVDIPEEPVPDFEFPNNLCEGIPVQFTNTSTGQYVSSSILWNFGDNAFTEIDNPEREYTGGGTYTATLSFQDMIGCSYDISQNVSVNSKQPGPFAIVNTTGSPTCSDPDITLSTNFPTSPISTHIWSTGALTPTIMPDESGDFSVTIVDANGCVYHLEEETVNISSGIQDVPEISIGGTGCEGFSRYITIGNYNSTYTYTWTHSDPSVISQTNQPWRLLFQSSATPGTYTSQVTATSPSGCVTTSEVLTYTINPRPVVSMDVTGSICPSVDVVLTASSDIPGSTFRWSGTQNTTNTLHAYEGGLYRVTVLSPDGCSENFRTSIPSPVTFDGLPTGCYEVCDGDLADGLPISWWPQGNGSFGSDCSYTIDYTWYQETPTGPVAVGSSSGITLTEEGDYYIEANINLTGDCGSFDVSACNPTRSDVISITEVACCDFTLNNPPVVNCFSLPNGSVLYQISVDVNNGSAVSLENLMITGPAGTNDLIGVPLQSTIPPGNQTVQFSLVDVPPLSTGNYCLNLSGVAGKTGMVCDLDFCITLDPKCGSAHTCSFITQGLPNPDYCEGINANGIPEYEFSFVIIPVPNQYVGTPIIAYGTGINITNNPLFFAGSTLYIEYEDTPPYTPTSDITLVFNDGNSVCTFTFQINIAPCGRGARMAGSELHPEISIYPNPARDMLHLSFPPERGIEAVRLMDMKGRTMLSESVEENDHSLNISTDAFANGVYLIEIINTEGVLKREKVVINH